MSKELKKNEHLKYEELSDAESAALSGGYLNEGTPNPNDDPPGQQNGDTGRPKAINRKLFQRFKS